MATTRATTNSKKDNPGKRQIESDATEDRQVPGAAELPPNKKSKPSPHTEADQTRSVDNGSNVHADRLTVDMQNKLLHMRGGGSYATAETTSLKPPASIQSPTEREAGSQCKPQLESELKNITPPTPLVEPNTSTKSSTCSQVADMALSSSPSPTTDSNNDGPALEPADQERPALTSEGPIDLPGSTPGDKGKRPEAETKISEFKAPKVSALGRVPESGLLYIKGTNREVHLPWCKLKDHIGNAPEFAERILNISSYAVGNNIASIFSAEPRDFHNIVNSTGFKNRHVFAGSKGRKIPDATFIIIGRVTESNLREPFSEDVTIRQVCLQPIERMLPRIVAATSRLTGYKKPNFEVKGDGIAFVTKRKPKYDNPTNSSYVEDDEDPLDGVTHGPTLRSFEEPVPIFDGRAPFKLVQYNTLPEREEELERGDFALVAYTISGWMSQANIQRVTSNIQFAILLREYDTGDKVCTAASLEQRPDLFEENYIGVEGQAPMVQFDPAGKVRKAELPKGRIMMDGPCM